jgi:CRISPR/Cas system-associated exonuclease Cas4 (RecB family)
MLDGHHVLEWKPPLKPPVLVIEHPTSEAVYVCNKAYRNLYLAATFLLLCYGIGVPSIFCLGTKKSVKYSYSANNN